MKRKTWNKFLVKETKELFQYCIDDDFNPDMVQLFGMDSYEKGFIRGCAFGIIGALLINKIAIRIQKEVKERKENIYE